jgi:hypothetical protein
VCAHSKSFENTHCQSYHLWSFALPNLVAAIHEPYNNPNHLDTIDFTNSHTEHIHSVSFTIGFTIIVTDYSTANNGSNHISNRKSLVITHTVTHSFTHNDTYVVADGEPTNNVTHDIPIVFANPKSNHIANVCHANNVADTVTNIQPPYYVTHHIANGIANPKSDDVADINHAHIVTNPVTNV